MILRSFRQGNDWSREAGCQQTLIVRALYEDKREAVEAMMGDDGVILKWQHNGGYSWPPSYCVIRSLDGRYFVNWAGTTNLKQVGGHMFGSLIVPLAFTPTQQILSGRGVPNIPWLVVYFDQWEDIKAVLPDPLPTNGLHFFGHSYGGAIATLAGVFGVKEEGIEPEVMTIGCPRVFTAGPVDPIPDFLMRLESTGDLVTVSPPDIDAAWITRQQWPLVHPITFRKLTKIGWAHIGDSHLLAPDGSNDKEADAPVPLPEFVTNAFYQNHFTANYFGRILASWRRQLAGEDG